MRYNQQGGSMMNAMENVLRRFVEENPEVVIEALSAKFKSTDVKGRILMDTITRCTGLSKWTVYGLMRDRRKHGRKNWRYSATTHSRLPQCVKQDKRNGRIYADSAEFFRELSR